MEKRRIIQLAWAALSNSFITGFAAGKIYKGDLKNVCVPGLNCSSCPGALGACPLGALQSVVGGRRYQASVYVAGLLLLFGAALGRFVCGFLCPFGLIQELLHKLPFPKKIRVFRGDKPLRRVKYLVLALLIVLPMFLTDVTGNAPPFFCKYVCPAGTLEAGVPLLLSDGALRAQAGWITAWKFALLAAVILLSVMIYRPFCRYLCPLGAVYALLNPVSLYRLRLDDGVCTHCGACARACPMAVPLPEKCNHPECVRCGKCVKACPQNALRMGFTERKGSKP